MKKTALVVAACALALALGFSGPTRAADKPAAKAVVAEKAAPAEKPAKESTVKGMLEKGAAEGSFVIKVTGKKKTAECAVAPDSPKAAELAALVGKKVEAKGVVKKGEKGEKVISVMEIKELAEKKK
jgi:hypothetical protein